MSSLTPMINTTQASQMYTNCEIMSSEYINIMAKWHHPSTHIHVTHVVPPVGWSQHCCALLGSDCMEKVATSVSFFCCYKLTHPRIFVVWLDDGRVPLSGTLCAVHLHTEPNKHRRRLEQNLLTSLVLQPMSGRTVCLLALQTLVTDGLLLVKTTSGISITTTYDINTHL